MDRRALSTLLVLFGALFMLFLVAMMVMSIAIGGSARGDGSPVGVVKLQGVIRDSQRVIEELHELAADDELVGIILRIDSPGGSVGPSQEIFEEVVRVRKELKKPIVASMGGVAASGGYYAAIGCDKIVANPGTITGSVGVISHFLHAEELVAMLPLKPEVHKSGELKDSGSLFRAPTPADRALWEGLTKDIFDQFSGSVKAERKLEDAAFAKIADGRVVSGRQAKELGLVDELGNLGHAARLVLSMAGVEGKPRLVYPQEEVPRWVRRVVQDALSGVRDLALRSQDVAVEYRAPIGGGR